MRIIFYYNIILCCIFYIICESFHYTNGQYEDSPCRNSNGDRGICKTISTCPKAINAIKILHHHHLKRCGFEGFNEIVCCPTNSDTLMITTTSKNQIWTDDNDDNDRNNNNNNNDDIDNNNNNNNNNDRQISSSETNVRSPLRRKSIQICEEYTNEIGVSITPHIVEGKDAEPGEFPHMAALGYQKDDGIEFNCGGSLISERYVLTAAHCIINIEGIPPSVVRLGTVILSTKPGPSQRDFIVDNFTVHPQYKWKEKLNDIALIKLNKNVVKNGLLYPACIYHKNDDPPGLIISGWGVLTLGGNKSIILQKANLTAVSLIQCNNTFFTRIKRNIWEKQICAADKKSDACQGDSGGPLQIQIKESSSIYSIVGVTSYGIGCGSKYPGIYTRVSSYIDWIESIVWP